MTSSDAQLLRLLGLFSGLAVIILWLIIGWRVMKAHESMAATAAEWLRQQPSRSVSNPRHPATQSTEQPPALKD